MTISHLPFPVPARKQKLMLSRTRKYAIVASLQSYYMIQEEGDRVDATLLSGQHQFLVLCAEPERQVGEIDHGCRRLVRITGGRSPPDRLCSRASYYQAGLFGESSSLKELSSASWGVWRTAALCPTTGRISMNSAADPCWKIIMDKRGGWWRLLRNRP